jgi:hypothetical protein
MATIADATSDIRAPANEDPATNMSIHALCALRRQSPPYKALPPAKAMKHRANPHRIKATIRNTHETTRKTFELFEARGNPMIFSEKVTEKTSVAEIRVRKDFAKSLVSA